MTNLRLAVIISNLFVNVLFYWLTLQAPTPQNGKTLKQFVGKLPKNCLSVFDHFVVLALKGLKRIANSVYFVKIVCHHSYKQSLFKKYLLLGHHLPATSAEKKQYQAFLDQFRNTWHFVKFLFQGKLYFALSSIYQISTYVK